MITFFETKSYFIQNMCLHDWKSLITSFGLDWRDPLYLIMIDPIVDYGRMILLV